MLNFFTKALIKRQMKGVPEAELNKIFEMIEKNPDFFKQMAESIQAKMKTGMSQEDAAKAVMAEGGDDFKKVMSTLGK
jgi:phospholipid N-methyltransferase